MHVWVTIGWKFILWKQIHFNDNFENELHKSQQGKYNATEIEVTGKLSPRIYIFLFSSFYEAMLDKWSIKWYIVFSYFQKKVFDISFPNLAFLSKCYCAGSCNLYFRMTGLLRFNDKFELFVFLKIHFIIMDFFWKGTNIAQKSFFGRQRNRLCDDCFLIWSFQLWATFGWTTQSSTSSDKNGWIHFVFLQLIFGLLSNVDR